MRTKKRFKGICFLLALLMMLGQVVTVSAAEGWQMCAPMNEARSNFSAEEVDGKIYVFGGNNSNVTYLNSVEEYDSNTKTWTTKAPMPEGRFQYNSEVVDGKIYIIGGFGPKGDYTNTVYEYTPATDTWVIKASVPTLRSISETITLDEKVYVIGGYTLDGTLKNTVEVYDPATDTWETKAPMINPRYLFKLAENKGKIYAIGGRADLNNPSSANLTAIEEYDPSNDTWTIVGSISKQRLYVKVAVENDKIYILGGTYSQSVAEDRTNTIEVFDIISKTTSIKSPMITKRVDSSMIMANGMIYAVGGKDDKNQVTNVFEVYNVKTDTWETKLPMDLARTGCASILFDGEIYIFGGINSTFLNSVEKYRIVSSSPKQLTATGKDGSVDLSWNESADTTGYNVYRSTTSGGPYTKIAEGITQTTYTDNDVVNGTTYYYVVTGITAEGGETGYSNEASASPKSGGSEPDDPTPTGKGALLEINMIDGTAKEFDLSMDDVSKFISEYDGGSKSYFMFDKPYNKGAFKTRTEYIIFDKIRDFEVNQYD